MLRGSVCKHVLQARIRALRMSFIVEKSTALPSLAEVVEKSGHAFNLVDQSAHMIAESTTGSPGHNLDTSMSSDEPSQACKAEVFVTALYLNN